MLVYFLCKIFLSVCGTNCTTCRPSARRFNLCRRQTEKSCIKSKQAQFWLEEQSQQDSKGLIQRMCFIWVVCFFRVWKYRATATATCFWRVRASARSLWRVSTSRGPKTAFLQNSFAPRASWAMTGLRWALIGYDRIKVSSNWLQHGQDELWLARTGSRWALIGYDRIKVSSDWLRQGQGELWLATTGSRWALIGYDRVKVSSEWLR